MMLFKYLNLILFIVSSSLLAQINISGFFDLQHSYSLSTSKEHKVEFGQFEIGLEKKISEKLNIEGAIAFNSETGNFELGSGFAEFNLLDHAISDGYLPHNFDVMVGQFDVPFGIDYQCIASPDRDMISQPLAIERSIKCLNSLGLELHGASQFYNFNLYLINNFLNEISYGSRLGLFPLANIEIGLSHLSTINSLQTLTPKVNGVDLKYDFQEYQFKSVFYWTSRLSDNEEKQVVNGQENRGYYLQGLYSFMGPFDTPVKSGIRFGKWENYNSLSVMPNSKIYRITALLGIELMQSAKLKVEYSTSKFETNSNNHIIFTQLVLTF